MKYKMYDKKTGKYIGIRDLNSSQEDKKKAGFYTDAKFIKVKTKRKKRSGETIGEIEKKEVNLDRVIPSDNKPIKTKKEFTDFINSLGK